MKERTRFFFLALSLGIWTKTAGSIVGSMGIQIDSNVSGRKVTKDDKLSHNLSSVLPSLHEGPNETLTKKAEILGNFFLNLAQIELGVKDAETHYGQLPFNMTETTNPVDKAKDLANKFRNQLKEYEGGLERLAAAVKASANELFQAYNTSPIPDCCTNPPNTLAYEEYLKNLLERKEACKTVPATAKPSIFVPSLTLSQMMVENTEAVGHVKWQYFVSPEGVYVEYPSNGGHCKDPSAGLFNAKAATTNKKMWLIEKRKEETRNHRLLFLLNLPNDPQALKSVKNIILVLLRFLDEADEVGIVNGYADGSESEFLCEQLVPVNSWARVQVLNYLDNLRGSGSEEESGGLQRAIDMACGPPGRVIFPPTAPTIVHLTGSGVKAANLTVPCPIFMEVLFLGSENEAEKYKTSLLAIPSKNIWRVEVKSSGAEDAESFALRVASKLSSKKDWWSFSDILSQFYPREKEQGKTPDFSSPHWNHATKEAVIMSKKYVFHMERPLGIVAMEVPLAYFTQHFTYYSNDNVCDPNTYAFLIDKTGRVLAHPSLGSPDTWGEVSALIPIENIEVGVFSGKSGENLKFKMLNQPSGCHTSQKQDLSWMSYAWSVVEGYGYISIVGVSGGSCESVGWESPVLGKTTLDVRAPIVHMGLGQLTHIWGEEAVSLAAAGLHLAPSAFTSPADGASGDGLLRKNPNLHLHLMAYIGDSYGIGQNRGLKPGVRDHIAALSHAVPGWKRQFANSTLNKYFLRRFGVGGGGNVFLMYPGSQVRSSFQPASSRWFREAVKGRGKVTFSRPFLEGKVPRVSVSQAVYVGRPGARSPVAIFGGDLNAGFLLKLVNDVVGGCSGGVRCFLLDSAGFLVAHPSLALGLRGGREVHVTQVEPLLVIDLLQVGGALRKYSCHKLSASAASQRSLHRNYVFAETLREVLGEHCSRYSIVPVPNTNLILVTVHEACSSPTAFCPCSTVDNVCLNCLRMEPSDCECPCECPLEPSFCPRPPFAAIPDDVEPCEFPAQSLPMGPPGRMSECGSCHVITPTCHSISSQTECLGSYDCEWCTLLSEPGCATYDDCYGYSGLGEPDSIEIHVEEGSGSLVAVFVVLSLFVTFLGFVAWCWRRRSLSPSSSSPELHLLPLQEAPSADPTPLHHSSREESECEAEVAGRVIRARRFLPPRSPLGSLVDSDHGYSTMTGQEESSECGPDPPLRSRNINLIEADDQTRLIVPVTVHQPNLISCD